MPKITLGYWKIRGIAQPIRHLLSYTELEFEEVFYETKEKWYNEDKKNLGLVFPNIPYIIDGDFKLTESIAVAKYIIKKSGRTELLGKDLQDEGKVENLIGVFNDALKDIKGLFWNKDYEALKTEALEKARSKLNYIRDFIGDNQFALGYLTLVDFYLAENLAYFETLYPSEKANYKFWWNIRKNLNNLPGIKAYYKRPNAVNGPYLPPYSSLAVKEHQVQLGYWGIRGLAQTPRHLLAFSGVKFEDKLYTNADDWFKGDKVNLGLDFPNIPYLFDGDYEVTESAAVQRYIINRWGKTELLGKNIQDNARIESYLSLFNEIAGAVKGLFFDKDHEKSKGAVIEKYRPRLE